MEALCLNKTGIKTVITRGLLKSTAQNMIRKDLEIFRIQDTMFELFNEVEFFSRCDDEFLSVDQTIQFAYGKNVEEVDQTRIGQMRYIK